MTRRKPFNVGDRVVGDARVGLDLLLADCGRYMQKHTPEVWAHECAPCQLRQQSAAANHSPCGVAFTEMVRLTGMLWGVGLSERFVVKRRTPRLLCNRYGRLVYRSGKRAADGTEEDAA